MLAEAEPRNLQQLQEQLDAALNKCEDEQCFPDGPNSDFSVTRVPPHDDFTIDWIYIIDLDRNTFHVNGQPFFLLDNLPDPYTFVAVISEDSYKAQACSVECPAKFQYNWKVPPPAVDESVLARYHDLSSGDTAVSMGTMLSLHDHLTDNESVRVGLIEVLIGQCITNQALSVAFKEFESFADHREIEPYYWSIACLVANLPFNTYALGREPDPSDRLSVTELVWVRRDTCVHITTHLDDEKNLQGSVVRLVDEVMKCPNKDAVVFGVAFSIYHCVIVRINRLAGGSFTHTPALQFLLSFFATSPSTEGITALVRLAHRPDPDIMQRYLRACPFLNLDETSPQDIRKDDNSLPVPLSSQNDCINTTQVGYLPTEIWQKIALLMDVDDLVSLGHVSRSCRGASLAVMHLPHVRQCRLEKVIAQRVYCAVFAAKKGDIDVQVRVGDIVPRYWARIKVPGKQVEGALHLPVQVPTDPAMEAVPSTMTYV
ncbi:hypothetical protein SERLA73DRAFT_158575 [Serpula lacrymans var. lacrymans S7.3]|uniref:F-box domain-containing protein n=2 Tax=Serpula lacrymans var. lacrymans TaxID=341189 RepID=F8PMI1_SERL3|nr:uncharacterized protein SERLADRAFT_413386 [Serpula lacrymans var. lacrymans S7.9]EGO02813.1 hypothetical protein SERLA73DRAFT_158575 [Serpula lacrymans var. lacrymans S7.3]EGO28515.1 hypothetical protein SERLADRAFT_413386 [Serpula lacrymans var. lacrymans S7.9]